MRRVKIPRRRRRPDKNIKPIKTKQNEEDKIRKRHSYCVDD